MKTLSRFSDDLLVLAGCICVQIGIAMWSIPITWIVGGLMLICFGVIVGKRMSKHAD